MHAKSEAEFPEGFDLILSEGHDSTLNHQAVGPWEMYPYGFIRAQPATGGSQEDSHSLVEYAELVGKDNLKMACKDDRIWRKSLLFIYAKICVNVKCHLHHALFMV